MASRSLRIAAAVVSLLAVTAIAAIDARAADRVDPAKKSKYSTSGALKPSQIPYKKAPIDTSREVTVRQRPVKRAAVENRQAPINVEEARKKHLIEPQSRRIEVVQFKSEAAAELPSSIPRIRREDFQRMMSDYEDGRVPVNAFRNAEVLVEGRAVSIEDINKFAGPRRALDAQGIPIIRAAESEEEPKAASDRRPVIPGMEAPSG